MIVDPRRKLSENCHRRALTISHAVAIEKLDINHRRRMSELRSYKIPTYAISLAVRESANKSANTFSTISCAIANVSLSRGRIFCSWDTRRRTLVKRFRPDKCNNIVPRMGTRVGKLPVSQERSSNLFQQRRNIKLFEIQSQSFLFIINSVRDFNPVGKLIDVESIIQLDKYPTWF